MLAASPTALPSTTTAITTRPPAAHRFLATSSCPAAKSDMRSSTTSLAALKHMNSIAYVTKNTANQLQESANNETLGMKSRLEMASLPL
jgi:hypothetical protein